MAGLKLSAEKREKVRQIVLADLTRAEDFYRQTVEPRLLHRREVYNADKDYYKQMFPRLTFSDYTSHDFYSWVQWALSTTLDSFFGTTDVISIVGQGQDDADSAETMGELIKWQIEQGNKGFLLFSSWFEDALVYDFGIMKCWWSRVDQPQETVMKVAEDRLAMLAQTPGIEIVDIGQPDYFLDYPVRIRKMVTTDNKPVLNHVTPFDLRWLPEARSLDESLFVAQRQIVTGNIVLMGAQQGVYDRKEARMAVEEADTVSYEMADKILNPNLEMFPAQEEDEARKHIELYECYVKMDLNDDGQLEDLIVTVSGDRILSIEENPLGRLPFFTLSTKHDETQVLSETSMADIEGELQNLRVAMIRQILLNTSVTNRPRFFVNESMVNIEDLVRGKEIIRCKGSPSEIMSPASTAPLANWTMPLIEYFRSVEEEWTGKTRYNQGTDANTLNKTATGISLIMKSSAARINHVIKIFAETGVCELNRFLVKLNQMFMDQEQVIRLLNRSLTIQPDDLEGNFDIVVNSDVGLGEKEQKTNVLTSYLQEMFPAAMQLGIADPADFSRAATRLLELLGWKDAKSFLRSPEEIQMRMMQAQQAQAMQIQGQAMQQQALGAVQAGDPSGVDMAGKSGAQAGQAAAMQALAGGGM